MSAIVISNQDFISTKEAAQLSSYTLKSVRDWCLKHRGTDYVFKHSNKWYLHKETYLNSVADQ